MLATMQQMHRIAADVVSTSMGIDRPAVSVAPISPAPITPALGLSAASTTSGASAPQGALTAPKTAAHAVARTLSSLPFPVPSLPSASNSLCNPMSDDDTMRGGTTQFTEGFEPMLSVTDYGAIQKSIMEEKNGLMKKLWCEYQRVLTTAHAYQQAHSQLLTANFQMQHNCGILKAKVLARDKEAKSHSKMVSGLLENLKCDVCRQLATLAHVKSACGHLMCGECTKTAQTVCPVKGCGRTTLMAFPVPSLHNILLLCEQAKHIDPGMMTNKKAYQMLTREEEKNKFLDCLQKLEYVWGCAIAETIHPAKQTQVYLRGLASPAGTRQDAPKHLIRIRFGRKLRPKTIEGFWMRWMQAEQKQGPSCFALPKADAQRPDEWLLIPSGCYSPSVGLGISVKELVIDDLARWRWSEDAAPIALVSSASTTTTESAKTIAQVTPAMQAKRVRE